MVTQYGVFLVNSKFIQGTELETTLWLLSFLGFSKVETGEKLLMEIYGYAVLLLLLIIEKHCIEYCESRRDIFKNYHWDASFQVWMSFRVIIEEAVVLCVLISAFNILTVASLLYVAAVIVTMLCPTSLWRLRVVSWVVFAVVVGEYGVMMSNFGTQVAPEKVPNSPFDIPWYRSVKWEHPEDDPTFLGLGTSQSQLYRLSEGFLISLLSLCYFEYLADKQSWLCDVTDVDLITRPAPKPISRKLKTAFYNSAHFFMLILILVFISQSTGLTALIYCLIVLALLLKANELIRGESRWNSYVQILTRYFQPILLVDLAMLIAYQAPYVFEHINSGVSWQAAIGLVRLWRAGGHSAPDNPKTNYLWVLFKVFTFAFLRLMVRMFTNEDFVVFMQVYRQEIWAKSASISLELAQDFNDNRLQKSAKFRDKKQVLDRKLSKLNALVQSWNRMYFSAEHAEALVRITGSNRSYIRSIHESTLPFSQKVFVFLLKAVNRFLFKDFVAALERKSGSSVLDNPHYILHCKDWGYLFLYILFSNSEFLCYFFFVLNHLTYASLESVFFPLSVLCYALLENPRPSPIYWRIMLFYTECVFLVKFILQMEIWLLLFGSDFLDNYQDPYKIGFNIVSNTYYGNLFLYTFMDVLCMLVILMHEYYLIRIGMDKLTETDIESLHSGKIRRFVEDGNCLLSFSDAPENNHRKKYVILVEIKNFFVRLIPSNKEEKPGTDYYTPIIIIQLTILVVIFCAFTGMDGEQQDIAQSFTANQFSGEMVVAIMCQICLILIDRYLYLMATSESLRRVDEEVTLNALVVEGKIGWNMPAVVKMIMHFLLTFGVHYLVFWWFPIQANLVLARSIACKELYGRM